MSASFREKQLEEEVLRLQTELLKAQGDLEEFAIERLVLRGLREGGINNLEEKKWKPIIQKLEKGLSFLKQQRGLDEFASGKLVILC